MPETGLRDEEYPWGLQLSLETQELKKLGIDPQNMKAGAKVMIEARGEVSNISIRKMKKGNDEKSMSLQIMKLDISEMP